MAKLPSEIAGAMMPPKKQKADSFPEFPVPANFQPPADVQPNEDFRALGTFRMKDNGMMCLTAVDGSPVTAGDNQPSTTY